MNKKQEAALETGINGIVKKILEGEILNEEQTSNAVSALAVSTKLGADEVQDALQKAMDPHRKEMASRQKAIEEAAEKEKQRLKAAERSSAATAAANAEAAELEAQAAKIRDKARKAAEESAAAEGKVIAHVPKPFKLLMPDNSHRLITAGTYALEKEIATHWYAKAHGVTIPSATGKKA